MANWINLANATFSGGVLEKTGGDNTFPDGGGNTDATIAGDGFVEARALTNDKEQDFGLGLLSGWDNHPSSIAYRWNLGVTGFCLPYVNGTPDWGAESQYAANDVFKVERDGTTIRFYKNGTEVSTVTGVTSIGTVAGLASLTSHNAAIDQTVVDGGTPPDPDPTRGRVSSLEFQVEEPEGPVSWIDLVNASFVDGVLTKTGGDPTSPDAGANTNAAIGGDGFIEFRVLDNAKTLHVGLGLLSGWSLAPPQITYRWFFVAGFCVPVSRGTTYWEAESAFSANDTFKIERDGTDIKFYKNDTLQFTDTGVTSIGAVVGLASLVSADTAIDQTVLSGEAAEPEPARGQVSFLELQVPTEDEEEWPYGWDGWEFPDITASETITLNPGDNVQAALNTLGSTGGTLILNPGTYQVNLVLPQRATPHPILVRSATNANQPGPGERVTRDHAPYLATLVSANTFDPAIYAANNSQNYAFENLRIGPQWPDRDMVVLGGDPTITWMVSQRAEGFLFDRVLFDGSPTEGQHRAILANAKNIIVRGCSMYDFFERGRESHGLLGYNGSENILVENCFIEASGLNVMFGGASSARKFGTDGEGMQPRKFTMRDCHLSKNIAWRELPDEPGVKALFELKHLHGGLIERCLFEKNYSALFWPTAPGMIIKCLNDEQNESTIVTKDVMVRNCVIRDTGIPIQVVGEQDVGPAYPTDRMTNVRFHNILCHRINIPPYNGAGDALWLINAGHDTQFKNITWRTNDHSFFRAWYDNGEKIANGLVYANCAASAGHAGGVNWDHPYYTSGTSAIPLFWQQYPDALVTGNAIRMGNINPAMDGVTYISATDWDNSFDEFHRVIPNSPVDQVTTTDGKPPGADVDYLMAIMPWAFESLPDTDPTRGRVSSLALEVPEEISFGDPTQLAADDFDRADGGLGDDWTFTTGGFVIESNRVRGTADEANNYAFWNADSFPPDQWAEVKVIHDSGNPSFGCMVRWAEGNNGYVLVVRFGGTNDIRVAKVTNGTFQALHTYAETPVSGSVYRLHVQGNQLRVFEDGVQFGSVVEDSDFSAGQPGIRNFGTTGFIDDFAAGMVAEAAPVADIAQGGWTASEGNDLFAMLADEDSGTYIVSSAGAGEDTCRVGFGTLTQPAGGVAIVVDHRLAD